jgi:hypothetical protein
LLVGGLEHLLWLSIQLGIIIPTDEVIFFGGVGIPPTRLNVPAVFLSSKKYLNNWASDFRPLFDVHSSAGRGYCHWCKLECESSGVGSVVTPAGINTTCEEMFLIRDTVGSQAQTRHASHIFKKTLRWWALGYHIFIQTLTEIILNSTCQSFWEASSPHGFQLTPNQYCLSTGHTTVQMSQDIMCHAVFQCYSLSVSALLSVFAHTIKYTGTHIFASYCNTHTHSHTHTQTHIYIYHLYIINYNYNILPVVPHKAVAEVSKIGNL